MEKYEIPTVIKVIRSYYDEALIHKIATIEAIIQPLDAWPVQTIMDVLAKDRYECWAIIENDQNDKSNINVISYCIWSKVFEVVEILRIGTHPDYQRRGLAHGLINKLQQHVSQKDLHQPIEKILLEVREDNLAAIQLYEKMGFDVIHRRRNYYKNNTLSNDKQGNIKSTGMTCDALIMQYGI